MAYGRAKVKVKYKPKSERLVDQVREVLRYHHYSYRTERNQGSVRTESGNQQNQGSARTL